MRQPSTARNQQPSLAGKSSRDVMGSTDIWKKKFQLEKDIQYACFFKNIFSNMVSFCFYIMPYLSSALRPVPFFGLVVQLILKSPAPWVRVAACSWGWRQKKKHHSLRGVQEAPGRFWRASQSCAKRGEIWSSSVGKNKTLKIQRFFLESGKKLKMKLISPSPTKSKSSAEIFMKLWGKVRTGQHFRWMKRKCGT